MEKAVRKFFERYAGIFNRALGGDADMDEGAALYASEFIAASPAGVMAGKNDDQLRQVMAQGYARYRAMGMKEMRIRNVRLSRIDDCHYVAHVAWTAIYAGKDKPGRSDRFRRPLLRSEAGRRAEGLRLGIRRRAGASETARYCLTAASSTNWTRTECRESARDTCSSCPGGSSYPEPGTDMPSPGAGLVAGVARRLAMESAWRVARNRERSARNCPMLSGFSIHEPPTAATLERLP